MSDTYKPPGYSTVSPYLLVERAEQTISFLTRVFDAVELRRYAGNDGRIAHAELQIEDSVIMLADAPSNKPAIPSLVHIYVADVDATYQRALEAGAVSLQAPLKQDDPDRRAGVKQADGVEWWFATKVE